MIMRPLFQLPI